MSSVTVSDVKKLAILSALSITDDQAKYLTAEIDNILHYVEQLDEVAVDGLEPTYQVTGLDTVTRTDEVYQDDSVNAALLELAPDVKDRQIKVPKVF